MTRLHTSTNDEQGGEHVMAEPNEPTDEERVDPKETVAEDQAAETEADDVEEVEDVEMEDEEISERVRGGVRSISIPF